MDKIALELHPVTSQNWEALIDLKVRDDQRQFAASNLYSIAEVQFGGDEDGHWNLLTYGLYAEGEPVGFAMTGLNLEHPRCQGLILRLMLDERYQGRGYGREGMRILIEVFRTEPRSSRFRMLLRTMLRADSMRVVASEKRDKSRMAKQSPSCA